jgi:hypothetical protein
LQPERALLPMQTTRKRGDWEWRLIHLHLAKSNLDRAVAAVQAFDQEKTMLAVQSAVF